MEGETSHFRNFSVVDRTCEGIHGIDESIQRAARAISLTEVKSFPVHKYTNSSRQWLCFYVEKGLHGMCYLLCVTDPNFEAPWKCGQKIRGEELRATFAEPRFWRYHVCFLDQKEGTYQLVKGPTQGTSSASFYYIFSTDLTMESLDLLACVHKPRTYRVLEADCVAFAKQLLISVMEASGENEEDIFEAVAILNDVGGPFSASSETGNQSLRTTRDNKRLRATAQQSLTNPSTFLQGLPFLLGSYYLLLKIIQAHKTG